MRRQLFKLGLFLLLGAIVNVAVAWACVQFRSTHAFDWESTLRADENQWIARLGLMLDPEQEVLVSRYRSIGVDMRQFLWTPLDRDSAATGLGIELHAGAPFKSLRGEIVPSTMEPFRWVADVTSGRAAYQVRGLVQFGDPVVGWSDESLHRTMPIRPIWGGFAANTVFYASVLWILVAASGAVRRRVRVRRGLCPACAYPTGSSAACSECGRPVASRAS